ncbi:MAG: 50S ribosomal protein L4 [bacterium]|nr:50S ribosomal protein L4 [bacterium]
MEKETPIKKTPTIKVQAVTTPKKVIKLEAQVYDITGKVTGSVPLPQELFGVAPNDLLIAQYVRVYNANQRQGNAQVKGRSEVAGSTKKVWKQKGTGRARHGSGKSNIWRGGGVTFGPAKRDFSLSLNKKQKSLALGISLSQSATKSNVSVISSKGINTKPQTKAIVSALSAMDMHHKKVLFVSDEIRGNVFALSSRNIPRVDVIQSKTLNAYSVLNHDVVVFVDSALESAITHFVQKK